MSLPVPSIRHLAQPTIVRTSLDALGGEAQAILGNAASLCASVGFNSALGFVFWWLAARQFPAAAVGLAAAAISAMSLLGTAAMLGQGTALVGELHKHRGHEGALMSSSLITPAMAGFVFGALFAIVGGHFSPDFVALGDSWASVLVFAVGVVLTSVTLVIDQALVGLLLGGLQLWRNVSFALAKLLLLGGLGVIVGHGNGIVIYIVWAIGNVISVGFLAGVAASRGALTASSLPRVYLLRQLGSSGLRHHALNLALRSPGLALTLIVATTLSVAATAYFYASWMIMSLGLAASASLVTTLYAVSAGSPAALTHRVRFTVGLGLAIGVAMSAVLLGGGSLLLGLFGAEYAQQASGALRILCLSICPMVIKDHYVTIKRIHGDLTAAAAIAAVAGIGEVCGAIVGGRLDGLNGVASGWLIAVVLEAMFMGPLVFRTVRANFNCAIA